MADQVIGSMIGKLVGDSTHYIKELRHAESETKRATESMKAKCLACKSKWTRHSAAT